jgi:hypothetical protein
MNFYSVHRRRTAVAPHGPQSTSQRRRWPTHFAMMFSGFCVGLAVLLAPSSAQGATYSLALSPGRSATAVISDSSLTDATGSVTITVPPMAGRTAYFALQFRSPSPGTGYRTRVRILPDGDVYVSFSRVINGSETLLLSKPAGFSVVTGQLLRLEGAVTGSSPVALGVRSWRDGAAKPASWQLTHSDNSSARISTSGVTRIWGYSSAAASKSTTVEYSDATASGLSAGADTGLASQPPTTSPSTSPTTTSSVPTGKPSADTAGVPAGTTLKRHDGDIIIREAGTVLDKMDIHGFVVVRAANVKITNSIVRGGKAFSTATGLITNYGYSNLVIENVDLKAEYPSVYFDGIKGNNFTARRVHVVGNVDSVKIHGDNVTIEHSLLENTVYYDRDPYQGGGATHNDNVQILNGKNIKIIGNTIRGATNFGILGAANHGDVPNLLIDENWLDGGWCTLKLQEVNGWNESATVTDNKFGPNRQVKNCAFQAEPSVTLLSSSGNVYEADGSPVIPLRVDS